MSLLSKPVALARILVEGHTLWLDEDKQWHGDKWLARYINTEFPYSRLGTDVMLADWIRSIVDALNGRVLFIAKEQEKNVPGRIY